jgi:hypothetical protein
MRSTGNRAPATFLSTVSNAEKEPGLMVGILRRGLAVGNHTYRHDPLVMLQRLPHPFPGNSVTRLKRCGVWEFDAQRFALRSESSIRDCFRFWMNWTVLRHVQPAGARCGKLSACGGSPRKFSGAWRYGDNIFAARRQNPASRRRSAAGAEIEKILAGIRRRGLDIVPLAELIGREMMSGVRPS